MSAYACEPGRGSEPGAGWSWACAAAQDHDVWVLTHATNQPAVCAELAADPGLAARLHPVFLRAPRWASPLRRRGPARFLYYLVWQLVTCPRAAHRLHAEVQFDVVHHVTYAADWAPAGVSRLRGVPFVWGPVGGSSSIGRPTLWRRLGWRGAVVDVLRTLLLGVARLLVGRRLARRAACVLGQNSDVAKAFAAFDVVVEPNIALAPPPLSVSRPQLDRSSPRALYVGRLVPWKGMRLALDALRRPEVGDWQLDVFGDGPDRAPLERLATRWGLTGRVHFHGHRPRDQVLAAFEDSDVFLFPSTHDAAGWSVAEALSHGCPVVCLDLGGPASLVGPRDGVVVAARYDVVDGLVDALLRARALHPERDRWTITRLPTLINGIYGSATQQTSELAKSRA